MVMEILGADFQPGQAKDMIERDTNSIHNMDNKANSVQGLAEPITFGFVDIQHVMNGSTKAELDHTKVMNFPKDAVDEWPEPKQIHSFYFVKFRSFEDPKLKAKFEQADKEIQKKNQGRFQLTEALKEKRSERSGIISQLKPLTAEDKKYRAIIDGKRKEMEPFQAALGKLRTTENARKSEGLCSSEEELDDHIRSLHFRLQHESNTIAEEKQILKDIKYLEGTREKVLSNAAMKAKIGDAFGQREDMMGLVKQIGGDLDVMRKDQHAVRAKIKKLEEELKAVDDDISSLQQELGAVDLKKEKTFESINELRKARDDVNACFYQNRSLLINVKNLAARKDIASLEELCRVEGEKFMSQWNSSKAFRDDYERRILSSLDSRQLSRDGRMRNPDEKPIKMVEAATPSESDPALLKGSMKRPKEDISQQLQHNKVSTQKAQKDDNKSNEAEANAKAEAKAKVGSMEDTEGSYELGKSQTDLPVANEIDAAKLKAMKREEEIAKAKMALERKKKLAEKAEAKAAAKAQKEAEKKLKEKEKKARKKAGLSGPAPVEQMEEPKIVEPEEPEVNKEAPVASQSNEHKDNNPRFRNRQKGPVQLSKTILKRKKSPSYWVWAAPASILAPLIAVLGYYYYGSK